MPTIPVYNREVDLKPAFTQMNTVSASADSMGAAVGRGLQDVGQGIERVAQAKMTLVQKLAENEARTGKVAAMGRKNAVMLDPDNGILNRTGINAQGSAKAWETEAEKIRADVTAKMSPAAREIFNRDWDSEVVSSAGTVLSHEAGEMKRGLEESYVALADTYAESAVTYLNDPSASMGAIKSGVEVIRERGATMGWDAAKTDNAIAQYTSDTHKSVALTIAARDPLAGQAYLDAHKDEMTAEGSNYAAVSAVLKEAVTVKRADDAAAGFFTGGAAGATGGATDAAALIRQFEGFRETPYWDVTANRVGFGSDTITSADGTVRRVGTGDTVTREDAERDLNRRIETEFTPRAIGKVGVDVWSGLSSSQQAALVSITYNYGDLPDSVAAAVRSGDTTAAALAIRALGSDNDGVNAGRRDQEAQIFSGGEMPSGSGEYMNPAAIEAYVSTLPPEVQGMTRDSIFARYDTISKADTYNRKAANDAIFDHILQNGTMPTDPALLSTAGMENVAAARRFLEAGAPVESNEVFYAQLAEAKASNRAGFVEIDLNKYRDKLSKTDLDAMLKDQRDMRESGKSQLDFSAAHNLAKETVEAKIGPAPASSDETKRQAYDARVNALYREIEADMRAFQQAQKVAPQYDDILKMVTARTLPTMKGDDGWVMSAERGLQFEMGDPRLATEGFKLDAAAIVTQIPMDVYTAIVGSLGAGATPDEIAEEYQNYLLWATVDSTDGPVRNEQKFGGGR